MLTYSIGPNLSAAGALRVHAAMQEGFGLDWDVNPAEHTDTRMVIKSVPFGRMKLSLASLPRAEVTNAARPSQMTPDRPYNIYVSNRRHKVVTNNRSVILEPGDVTVADSAMAATMTTDEPYTTIGLTVPASVFRTYLSEPERAVGVRFSGKAGLSKVVSYLLLTMWEYAETNSFQTVAGELANNVLGILAACCQLQGHLPDADTASTVSKRENIRRIIDQNLHKPDLCVGEIARACGFSTRYVQRLFSEEQYTVSEYIRHRRLQGCKKHLADPAWMHHSITEIAFNWGFNSSAHFARVFRADCGMSAREFRNRALRRLSLDGSDRDSD